MDWDDAYANGKYIPNADAIAARWPVEAAAFRARTPGEQDLAYCTTDGATDRQRLDLFMPSGPAKGLFVFVHGGYWMSFDKSTWSHFAAGAVAAGWAAAVPSYNLAPEVSIGDMGKEIAQAITLAAGQVEGPLVLCGHSAGAHLVARMMCGSALLPEALAQRVRRVVGISGIYDLRPLLKTAMNDTLKLDAAEAQHESPSLHHPRAGFEMVVWVGADERPALIEQSDVLSKTWAGQVQTRCVHAKGRHHFDVINDLQDANSELMQIALAD